MPFAVPDVDQCALTIDVFHLQQTEFITAHAGAIEGCQDGPVLQIPGRIQNPGDLFGTENGRQRSATAGAAWAVESLRQTSAAAEFAHTGSEAQRGLRESPTN